MDTNFFKDGLLHIIHKLNKLTTLRAHIGSKITGLLNKEKEGMNLELQSLDEKLSSFLSEIKLGEEIYILDLVYKSLRLGKTLYYYLEYTGIPYRKLPLEEKEKCKNKVIQYFNTAYSLLKKYNKEEAIKRFSQKYENLPKEFITQLFKSVEEYIELVDNAWRKYELYLNGKIDKKEVLAELYILRLPILIEYILPEVLFKEFFPLG